MRSIRSGKTTCWRNCIPSYVVCVGAVAVALVAVFLPIFHVSRTRGFIHIQNLNNYKRFLLTKYKSTADTTHSIFIPNKYWPEATKKENSHDFFPFWILTNSDPQKTQKEKIQSKFSRFHDFVKLCKKKKKVDSLRCATIILFWINKHQA